MIGGASLPGLAAAQEKTPDSMADRVLACAACHGVQGEGNSRNPYFPRLGGQPADYLSNQLRAFRDDHRKYGPMNYLTTYLSDGYLHEIATYFSKLRPTLPAPAAPTAAPATLEAGRKLVMEGDAARKVPACVACHGEKLTGREPGIPGLLGFSKEYVSAQLGAFRAGVRHGTAPDCMQQVATRLSDADIAAVSAWLAAQPAPQDLAPTAAGTTQLPLVCGSQQR
ncbi:Cytochrome c553 [Chitinasiproducens palmae]|uniref:Cytochrome c553 n=2 Tax=Chitinasiproducens palmae TaxID=1770053 RepID=A0A1H2PQ36_9BURK|nr:Cytochrome c553 [Chitinasiproducens palmae]